MTQQKVLLTWKSNWADEMDIYGFVITTDHQWETYKKNVKEKDEEFTLCIGTNEDIYYNNGTELLSEISVSKLSDQEVDIISKNIGTLFGFTQFFNEDETY